MKFTIKTIKLDLFNNQQWAIHKTHLPMAFDQVYGLYQEEIKRDQVGNITSDILPTTQYLSGILEAKDCCALNLVHPIQYPEKAPNTFPYFVITHTIERLERISKHNPSILLSKERLSAFHFQFGTLITHQYVIEKIANEMKRRKIKIPDQSIIDQAFLFVLHENITNHQKLPVSAFMNAFLKYFIHDEILCIGDECIFPEIKTIEISV